MPQMMPMNWIFLYLIFSLTFLYFNFLNYYLFLIKNKFNLTKKYSNKFMIWKW